MCSAFDSIIDSLLIKSHQTRNSFCSLALSNRFALTGIIGRFNFYSHAFGSSLGKSDFALRNTINLSF